MVEGGFKRARVHNNFKSEDLSLERKVCLLPARNFSNLIFTEQTDLVRGGTKYFFCRPCW